MKMRSYDTIVVGCGGVGSAALYHLAKQGARVVGIDRFPPGHDRGSSHGQTRMIRLAYYEHAHYVPLLLSAYSLWHELEQAIDEQLLLATGLFIGGLPDSRLVTGVRRAASEHQLPIEDLTRTEMLQRFSGFQLPEGFTALFERRAGYLKVENCVMAHAKLAQQAGAELAIGSAVREWRVEGNGVTVTTDSSTYVADRIVIAPGPWAGELLGNMSIPFQVLRKPLFWYRTHNLAHHQNASCPCFLFETEAGVYYGFPKVNELGIKVAEHSGGQIVSEPLKLDRSLHVLDQRRIEDCLTEHLPGSTRECTAHSVCMYTMSPDGHFIVGQHPEYSQVAFVAGLSGHGFKFTSVLGEIMADLTLKGRTDHPIQFLSPTRFAAVESKEVNRLRA